MKICVAYIVINQLIINQLEISQQYVFEAYMFNERIKACPSIKCKNPIFRHNLESGNSYVEAKCTGC